MVIYRIALRMALAGMVMLSFASLALGITLHALAAGSPIVVTTTADSSSCPDANGGVSLRCAIQDADAAPGSSITFNIPPTIGNFNNNCITETLQGTNVLVCIIAPTVSLPALTASNTTIDGYTQPGATPNSNALQAGDNAILTVQLDGSSAGPADGLLIQSSNDTIEGLSITNFSASGMAGIHMQGDNKDGNAAQGSVISGNFIGVAPDGVTAGPNDRGIFSEQGAGKNMIGGGAPAARNLISGNTSDGILDSALTVMEKGRPRQYGNHNKVQGNYVGTDATGMQALNASSNNGNAGVTEDGDHSVVGGLASGEGNIISGNTRTGLFANGNKMHVEGNYIGVNAAGTSAVGNGLAIGSSGIYGMCVCGAHSKVLNNLVSGNSGTNEVGLESAGGDNTIQGNLIGTDVTGKYAIPNDLGLEDSGGHDKVGGTTATTRNVISGNLTGNGGFLSSYGLESDGGFNTIVGNFIGTDITGSMAIPNGVGMESSGGYDNIGVKVNRAGNVISGNLVLGLWSDGGNNTIIDNFIGTDRLGRIAIPNGPSGSARVQHRWARHGRGRMVFKQTSPHFTLPAVGYYADGGLDTLTGNVISGNNGDGVNSDGGMNTFLTNMIGTTLDAKTALPNRGNGVTSSGGQDSFTSNIISGNLGNGVYATSSVTLVGNNIGIGADMTVALGNGVNGVEFDSTNTVNGGMVSNTIANNAQSGVLVGTSAQESGLHIAMLHNQFFANGGLGIDLAPQGVVNCNTSPPGPNDYTPCPIITGINTNGGSTTITGTACSGCTVQVFTATNEQDDQGYGEGNLFLGEVTADPLGNWSLTISQLQSGTYVTAATTTPKAKFAQRETSEFALNVQAP